MKFPFKKYKNIDNFSSDYFADFTRAKNNLNIKDLSANNLKVRDINANDLKVRDLSGNNLKVNENNTKIK